MINRRNFAKFIGANALCVFANGCTPSEGRTLRVVDNQPDGYPTVEAIKYFGKLMNVVILLILGAFMDMAPLIIITTPIFLPIVMDSGVDPVHFGIIMLLNLGIGLVTPPVGSVLFVGCAVGDAKPEKVIKTIWPFYGALIFVLLLITFVPSLSLWLPGRFG